MLWLCLILVCFFYKFALHFSFPSFVPSVCIYPALCFCSFSSYLPVSEFLLFSLPIICFLKVFFPPLAFLSPRVSLFILLFYLFPFVVFCYYFFFYCQLFYFLLFLFFASFTFFLLSSVVFFHFSFIALSFLFLICFPFTFVPSFLPSHPWPLYSLVISLFPLSSSPHFPSSSLLIVSSSSPFHLPPASSPVFFSSSPLHLLVFVYPEAQSQELLSSVGWWGCGVTSTFLSFFGRVSRNRGGSHWRPVYMYGWVANLMLYTYLFKHVRAAQ